MHGPLHQGHSMHPAAAADVTTVSCMHPVSAGLGLHARQMRPQTHHAVARGPYLQERLCLLQHLLELCLGRGQLLLRVCHPPHC